MVLDTSAVLAILLGEAEADRLLAAIDASLFRRLSAATLVEVGMVVHARLGEPGERELDLLMDRLGIEIVSVTASQAEVARSAFRRFGKGRHQAGLNFGDCFAYALAMSFQEPLLFKGNDFLHSDIQIAIY